MASILDKLSNILSDQEIKDFLTGKKNPQLNVNTQVEMEAETLKSLAIYLFLALAGFALVLAYLLFWAMKMALKGIKSSSF